MLDVWHADAKTGAINDMFDAIGSKGDTRMPRSRLNTEPVAWEYYVASHLLRIAEARRKKAQTAAVRYGIMFDAEKAPLSAETHKTIYVGEVVAIDVSVSQPREQLDIAGLLDDLIGTGFTRSRLDRMVAKRTIACRAPHKFIATLLTG
jgi:hypothetical protein